MSKNGNIGIYTDLIRFFLDCIVIQDYWIRPPQFIGLCVEFFMEDAVKVALVFVTHPAGNVFYGKLGGL